MFLAYLQLLSISRGEVDSEVEIPRLSVRQHINEPQIVARAIHAALDLLWLRERVEYCLFDFVRLHRLQ